MAFAKLNQGTIVNMGGEGLIGFAKQIIIVGRSGVNHFFWEIEAMIPGFLTGDSGD